MHLDAPQQELRLGVEPDAVPRARRFASSVLSGLASGLVGDAELIVTELVTNALLYAGPPVTLRVLPARAAYGSKWWTTVEPCRCAWSRARKR